VRFRTLLSELAHDRIVLLSTHIVSDLESTATRIVLIAKGRLVADGTPEALLARAQGRVWECVVASDALPALQGAHRVSQALRRADGVHVRIVADTAPAPDARAAAPTLEDAYLAAVGMNGAK